MVYISAISAIGKHYWNLLWNIFDKWKVYKSLMFKPDKLASKWYWREGTALGMFWSRLHHSWTVHGHASSHLLKVFDWECHAKKFVLLLSVFGSLVT